jgi:hypothetical protein
MPTGKNGLSPYGMVNALSAFSMPYMLQQFLYQQNGMINAKKQFPCHTCPCYTCARKIALLMD